MCCEEQSSRLTDTELSISQNNENNNLVSKMSSVMKARNSFNFVLLECTVFLVNSDPGASCRKLSLGPLIPNFSGSVKLHVTRYCMQIFAKIRNFCPSFLLQHWVFYCIFIKSFFNAQKKLLIHLHPASCPSQ